MLLNFKLLIKKINNHTNRLFFICKYFVFIFLIRIKAKQNNILLVAQFTKNTGTHTYVIQMLSFLCDRGYNVILLTHVDNTLAIQELHKLFSFRVEYYKN